MERHPHPGRCSWGILREVAQQEAVIAIWNASRGSAQLAVTWVGLEHPPLCNNFPVVRWPPLERRDNQPPIDRPPLEVVFPPLESGLFGVLLVLLVLCCIVPLLLQPRFLLPLFLVKRLLTFFNASAVSLPAGILPWSAVASCWAAATTWDSGETVRLVMYWCLK